MMKSLAEVLSGGLPHSKWQPPPRDIELPKTYRTITTGPKRTIWYKSQIISQRIVGSAELPQPIGMCTSQLSWEGEEYIMFTLKLYMI